jgi:hypothetical protein
LDDGKRDHNHAIAPKNGQIGPSGFDFNLFPFFRHSRLQKRDKGGALAKNLRHKVNFG